MTQAVQLVNPVAHQFAAFAVGNATMCDRVVERDSAKGQHIVICGAGPSLAEEAHRFCRSGYDQLWGCNSALIWLLDNGYQPTHGFTIDQTAHMVEEWYDAPDVEYLVASTVHPHLTEWLQSKGRTLTHFHNFCGMRGDPVEYGVCPACKLAHSPGMETGPCNQCGGELTVQAMTYEDWLYMALFPPTARVGSGLNSVSRAIDLAVFMGARMTVLGADCAMRIKSPPRGTLGSREHKQWLKQDVVMHADGSDPLRSGATATTMGAEIDTPRNRFVRWFIRRTLNVPVLNRIRHLPSLAWGLYRLDLLYTPRWWQTKPDMAITAVFLSDMADHYGRRLRLIGDTLPNALVGKDRSYLERLPSIVDGKGNVVSFNPGIHDFGNADALT
jgi:hypothetical protein